MKTNNVARLADHAFSTCRTCMVFVPKLQSLCSGVKPHRQPKKAWQTQMPANIYLVSPTDQIIISSWEERCARLSLPVTRGNFPEWWKCVHDSVLEHWWVNRDEYDSALKQIGQAKTDEWKRRSMALDRVKQAFEGLVQNDQSESRTATGTKSGQL